jgi:hypothetical protein
MRDPPTMGLGVSNAAPEDFKEGMIIVALPTGA